VPVDWSAALIATPLPSGDFASHGREVRETAIKALAGEGTEFDLGDIQPTAMFGCMMNF